LYFRWASDGLPEVLFLFSLLWFREFSLTRFATDRGEEMEITLRTSFLYQRIRFRNRQTELMDNPDLDPQVHDQALAGLRRINWWSRTGASIWEAIERSALSRGSSGPLTILDIASGGGDHAIWLAKKCQQRGIPFQIHGCDISATAVENATALADRSGVSGVQFHQCDALHGELPGKSWDVVMNSLFLHHLEAADAVLILQRMRQVTRQLLLVDDLRRTLPGYLLAWVGCRILSRSPIVHFDGPVSVEGAFSDQEVKQLAEQAGLSGVRLQHHWPQRFLLSWTPEYASGRKHV
jgi:2-polyprenyl-3-methyl-5-hydroxy-6-metoxy-1,4-benzoquinol methylase